MIRVLHIVHAPTRGGGLTTVVMNYYRFIDRSKVQFDFLYFRDVEDNYIEEIESMGGRCFKLSEPSISSTFFKERDDFFKTHKDEWKHIHCHVLFAVSVFAGVAKKNGCEKIIAHSHSSSYGNSLIQKARNFVFVKQAKYFSDYKMACSKKAGDFMFGKKRNYLLIQNAIDTEKFAFNYENRLKVVNELQLEGKFVIGHIGGFTRSKNHKMIVDIFNELQKKQSDVALVLIGGDGLASNSTKPDIIDLIKKYDIEDKVKIPGLRTDANELMSAMDMFVMPSFFEGLPLTCVETQTNGLPSLLSDRITKEIGLYKAEFLPLEDSIDMWCDKILEIYNEKDRHLEERVNGKKIVAHNGYDIQVEAKKLCDFYCKN